MVIKANIVETKEINVNLNQGTGGFNSPVQSVNNKTGHVVLDANDVGALPKSTVIPTKVSQLENDEEYLKSYTETDPTVPAWAKTPQKPSYTFAEVGAEPAGAAVEAVNAHNTSENSHQDIRLLVQGLTTRLNALADSDDITLDQMSELVAYIKSNRSLINEITTKKINVSDIIDNLTTNVPNRPLSASQGVVLKSMIETLDKSVPTKTSQLTNDSGFLTEIPSEYVTDTELSGKGYMSEAKFNLGLYPIVKSVNNIKPDANGNVNVVGGDGTIVYKPTWDDLAQGNTVFVPLEVISDDVNYGGYHKVSDESPTLEQLQKGGKISFNEGGNGIVTKNYPEGDMVIIKKTDGAVIAFNGLTLAVIAFENGMSYLGNTFEKGIHFTQDDIVITHSLTVIDYIQTNEINPIPVEYLPKSHQFGKITTTLVDNQTFALDEGMTTLEGVTIEKNGTYTVIYNGVEYANLQASSATIEDVTAYFVGNTALVGGDDNGMPFAVVTILQEGTILIDVANSESCTVTITGGGIRHLDNKFLEPFEIITVGKDTLEWDGKPTEYYHEGSVGTLYFVSSATPTMEDLANGGTLSSVANGQIETGSLTSDQVYDHGSVIVLAAGMAVIVLDETKPTNWGSFEKKGVYFIKTTDGAIVTSLTINGYTGFTEEQAKLKPEYLPSGIAGGLTIAQVNALDGMFKKCAFTGDVEAEYEAFKTAFGITESGGEEEPTDKTLTSISATYTGGDVAVGTALTSLTGITVKATYSDGTTANVTGYTLSGTIAEGSNTITVSYGGKTTTFKVVGVAESNNEELVWFAGNINSEDGSLIDISPNTAPSLCIIDVVDTNKITARTTLDGWTELRVFGYSEEPYNGYIGSTLGTNQYIQANSDTREDNTVFDVTNYNYIVMKSSNYNVEQTTTHITIERG